MSYLTASMYSLEGALNRFMSCGYKFFVFAHRSSSPYCAAWIMLKVEGSFFLSGSGASAPSASPWEWDSWSSRDPDSSCGFSESLYPSRCITCQVKHTQIRINGLTSGSKSVSESSLMSSSSTASDMLARLLRFYLKPPSEPRDYQHLTLSRQTLTCDID